MVVGRGKIKFNTKVNGSGQECPLHTSMKRNSLTLSRAVPMLLCGAAYDCPAIGLDQQQLCSSVYEDGIEMES